MKIILLSSLFFCMTACSIITPPPYREAEIHDSRVSLRIASTIEDLGRGLGGVEQLPEDEGMLFIFPERSVRRFWMKDMLIPLDIIWIDDGKIVAISADVPPPGDLDRQDNLPRYSADMPVTHVLEVNAGWAAAHGVQVGDSVTLR